MFGFGLGEFVVVIVALLLDLQRRLSLFLLSKGLTVLLQDRYCPSKTCLHRVHRPGARFAVLLLAALQRERTHSEAYFALPKPQLPATLVGSCFSETQLCPSRVRHHSSPPATENEEAPSSHSAAAATAPIPPLSLRTARLPPPPGRPAPELQLFGRWFFLV